MIRFRLETICLLTWTLQAVITVVGHPLSQGTVGDNYYHRNKLATANTLNIKNPPPDRGAKNNRRPSVPCSVYMPFDIDMNGHSISHSFEPKQLGPPGSATLSSDTKARGSGSLKLDIGGSLEIPFAFNTSKPLSWCAFSHQGENNDRPSILLSKVNRSADHPLMYSIHNIITYVSVGLKYPGGLTANYVFPKPNGPENGGFVQLCITFDGKVTKFYQDKEMLFQLPNVDPFMRTSDAFIIGSPAVSSRSYIDEVLMCQWALSADEIAAHWDGQEALEKIGLIPSLAYYLSTSKSHHLHCHSPSCWKDPAFHRMQS